MRKTFRTRAAAMLGAVALVSSGLVGLSGAPAQAIPRTNECGSAYAFLKSWTIEWRGRAGGYIDVYYNRTNGYNCVMSRVNDSVITSWSNDIAVGARKSGGTWQSDGQKPGQHFTKYAGPLYVYAPNACIDIWGSFDASGGGGYSGYDRVHCS